MIVLAQESNDGLSDVGDKLLGASWEQWLTAGVVLAAALLVGRILKSVTTRLAARGSSVSFGTIFLGRLVMWIVWALGFVYALGALGIALGPVLGALGVAGIALAFALQDILGNFLAGIILIVRRPFEVGDQISTADFEGSVEDIKLRAVTLRTYDGTTVYIPNGTVLDNPIVNFTERGVRRTTFDVGVSYDADLDEVQQVILDTLSEIDGVEADPAPQAYVREMGDSSINFAVRYWHEPTIATMWEVRDRVARTLKRRFDDRSIEIPFPQRVLHLASADAPLSIVRNGSSP